MKDTPPAIEASKQFNKNVQELYDAWTNADKLKQWWHPAGNKLVHVENAVQSGGKIKYEFATRNGDKSFEITGQYKEVQPAVKLVYSWNWKMPGMEQAKENHYELTVEFSGDGNSSYIHIIQRELDAEESVYPHQKGWEEELERLTQFLG